MPFIRAPSAIAVKATTTSPALIEPNSKNAAHVTRVSVFHPNANHQGSPAVLDYAQQISKIPIQECP